MTSDTAISISPELLEHVRVALLGAAGILVEDLGMLTLDLEAKVERAVRLDLPDKYAAYRELMEAVQSGYELQRTIGLPGEPLERVELRRPAHQALVIEILTNYRDATVQLQSDDEMGDLARSEAAARLLIIDAFLAGRFNTGDDRVPLGPS